MLRGTALGPTKRRNVMMIDSAHARANDANDRRAVSDTQLWLRRPRIVAKPRVRLVCFAYAGGAATIFRRWSAALPADVEVCAVQLPGRQDRLSEAPLTSVDAIVAQLSFHLAGLSASKVALYGHSFGGVLAYELARQLESSGVSVTGLVVGACPAPHRPSIRPNIHHLDDAAFLKALQLLFGMPLELLHNEEVMSLALPSLRADITALETHRHVAEPQLRAKISVLAGLRDLLGDHAITGWSELTSGGAVESRVDGGHFFVDSQQAWTLQQVQAALRA
jgi:surfactin synthase thioesterase subunit